MYGQVLLTVRTEYTIGAITNNKIEIRLRRISSTALGFAETTLSGFAGDHSPLSLIRRSRIRDHS